MSERLLAEFPDEHAIAGAIRALRETDHRVLDAYTPFASHEVEDALARRPSRLPFAVFVGGMCGAGGAYFLQWYLVAHLYPLVVGGRPPHFPVAFVIITFEMGVLFASLTAVIATLVVGRLVRLTDDVQGTAGFETATRDRFWLAVMSHGPGEPLRELLGKLGASRVETPEVA
ncbi:MAG: DUF3341 domain-containing protein [Deltaproteobacteria bacterium]|nr:DUF3341 domain-containing protein [Deltaproteobacteria bacterium]MCW5808604.1 DUF3341 domain-containing protein [Deltaproteobacteria bacterium]